MPVAGIAGDQQAALFGQGCFAPGEAKATYGTGTFVLVNVGDEPGAPPEGLLTDGGGGRARRAERVRRRGLGPRRRRRAAVAARRARRDRRPRPRASGSPAASTRPDGVDFVPALTGLGSPYWEPDARGLICGLTRGTTRAHLVRAALEAIAHQVADVLDALPLEVAVLRADGGATANGFLMQLQADLLGCPVEVSADAEATALGVAALAGLGVGTWSGPAEVAALIRRGARCEPRMPRDEVERLRGEWRDALRRVLL